MADPQEKGAVGAGLLTGGSVGFPAALPFVGAFQMGYGLGMLVKSTASVPQEDPDFTTAVKLEGLKIPELVFSPEVPPSITYPANAAVQSVGLFVANIRALGKARNRMETAKDVGNFQATKEQKAAVYTFLNSAKRSLEDVSAHLQVLAETIVEIPDGSVEIDVVTTYKRHQCELTDIGFPEFEKPAIEYFQVTEQEQAGIIKKIAGIPASKAATFYGAKVTLQKLIREFSLNSREIADDLDTELKMPVNLFVASLGRLKLTPEIEAKIAGEVQAAVIRSLAEIDFHGDVHTKFPFNDFEVFLPFGRTLGIWVD